MACGRVSKDGQARFLKRQTLVAGLDDVAVTGEAIDRRDGDPGIAEDARPLAEGVVGVTMTEVRSIFLIGPRLDPVVEPAQLRLQLQDFGIAPGP